MLLHNTPLLRIYFGDAKDNLFPADLDKIKSKKNIFDVPIFAKLKDLLRIDRLIFLKQVHGNKGLIIRSRRQAKDVKAFTTEGDYLVTNAKSTGLGVVTADCLPIVIFDPFNQAIAVVHAGLRGSSKNVVLKAVDSMTEEFGTKPGNLKVFFGPSAKICCYTIGQDSLEQLEDFEFIDRVVQSRQKETFFDLAGFNKVLLESIGVKQESFKLDYNICTICDKTFNSYRRDGKSAGRQMTVASLQ